MSNKEGDSTGSFLAGFIVGGLVGAAVAVVLAPFSGEETRSNLTQRGQTLQNDTFGGEQSPPFSAEFDTAHSTAADRLHDLADNITEEKRIILDNGTEPAAEDSANNS